MSVDSENDFRPGDMEAVILRKILSRLPFVSGGGGGVVIGAPVTGGNPNSVLYNGPTGLLANSTTFVFDGTKLGVGLSSPTQALDVVGTGKFTAAATALLGIASDAGTANTPAVVQLQHNTSGTAAVGFGNRLEFLADSNGAASQSQARIESSWTVVADATRTSQILFGTRNSAAIQTELILSGGQSQFNDGTAGAPAVSFRNDLDVGMWRPGANLLAFSTAGVEALRIGASQNVGVGDTAPAAQVDVKGGRIRCQGGVAFGTAPATGKGMELTYDTTSSSALITSFNRDTSAYGPFFFSGSSYTMIAVTADPIIFQTTSIERLRIDPAGLVGIGTGSPNEILSVNGGASGRIALYNTLTSSTNFERLDIQWSGNVAQLWTEKGSGGGTARDFVLGAAATELMRFTAATGAISLGQTANTINISAGGNVGINTVPSGFYNLEIGSSAGGNATIAVNGAAASQVGFIFAAAGSTTWFFYRPGSSSDLRFFDGSADQLTLKNGGFLGIGVSPTAALHLKAGTATASTAPFKFTPGVLLTAPEIGTMEFTDDGTTAHCYVTVRVATVVTRVQLA